MKKAINIIIAALVIVSMVAHVSSIVSSGGDLTLIITDATMIALGILALGYNFLGYKKPHGNLLRYTFLVYGIVSIISVFFIGKTELSALIRIIAGIIIVYMSGRLNKIEKNRILTIVVLILFVAITIISVLRLDVTFGIAKGIAEEMPTADPPVTMEMTLSTTLGMCSGPFLWLALSLAYTSRYKAHKEAGLEDKPNA